MRRVDMESPKTEWLKVNGVVVCVPPVLTRYSGLGGFMVRNGRHGLGVHAARNVRDGEALFQFHGARISFVDAVAKGEQESYALQIDRDTYVDLDPLGCLVNHSCNPNVGLRPDGWLIALRGVGEGEELRYDYSTTMDENYWTMPCECGEKQCRGRVMDFCTLPEDVRTFYLRRGIVQSHLLLRASKEGGGDREVALQQLVDGIGGASLRRAARPLMKG
jgi:hypothetical protein